MFVSKGVDYRTKPITFEGSYNSMVVFHPGLTCDIHFRGAFFIANPVDFFELLHPSLGDLMSSMILREPQHTPGAYPRPPQPPKLKEFLHKLLVLGLGYMFQGYVGKFLE